jgi:hypothetical protein
MQRRIAVSWIAALVDWRTVPEQESHNIAFDQTQKRKTFVRS